MSRFTRFKATTFNQKLNFNLLNRFEFYLNNNNYNALKSLCLETLNLLKKCLRNNEKNIKEKKKLKNE